MLSVEGAIGNSRVRQALVSTQVCTLRIARQQRSPYWERGRLVLIPREAR